MGKVSFLVGVVLRLVAVAFVFYIAAIPLSIFLIRAHEGLQDDPFFHGAAIACALLVFPALIFLGWFDAAVGSIVPLLMLAVILAALESTDPDYSSVPRADGLTGKNILVVGGNQGIGLGVVRAYLAQGARVSMTHHRSPPSTAIQSELSALGSFGGSSHLDMSDASSIDALAARVATSQDGKLDAVVINSGVYCSQGLSDDGIERTVGINTVGVARLTRALLKLLNHNATVIMSSSASSRGWRGSQEDLLNIRSTLEDAYPSEFVRCQMLYGRSKALLNAFVMRMAKEHTSVRFLSAFPNPTHTEMFEVNIGKAAEILHYPPFFRAGTPAFDSFCLFWIRALTRSVDKVGKQYVYGLISNLPSGSLFFKETPFRPMPYEELATNQISFL